MSKYEKLKNIIIEAVPEILELKFGCEVFPNRDGEQWFDVKIWVVVAVDDRKLILRPQGKNIDTDLQSVDIKYIKILGRKITLCDCLIAIQKPKTTLKELGKFYEKRDKLLEATNSGTGYYHLFVKLLKLWKWEDNNLDNQSQITKDFLTKLLVK